MRLYQSSEDDELQYDNVSGEIDLHNYCASEALVAFIEYYNREVSIESTGQIKVIHGYGSSGEGGRIRTMIRTFLKTYPNEVSYKDGENLDNNKGYTVVYPNLPLPSLASYISTKILEYCKKPKTEEKIINKFIDWGTPEVTQAVKALCQQKKLREEWKGKYKRYCSIV